MMTFEDPHGRFPNLRRFGLIQAVRRGYGWFDGFRVDVYMYSEKQFRRDYFAVSAGRS